MFIQSTQLALAFLPLGISAVPTRRQEIATSPDNMAKIMENGVKGFLGTQGVDMGENGVRVLLPDGGMEPITFLASDNWMNSSEANNEIFTIFDRNQDPSGGDGTIHYSDQVTNFVQSVTKAIAADSGTDITQDPDISEASDSFGEKCAALTTFLDAAQQRYTDQTGETPTSNADENFVSWAQENDPDYMNGIKNCDLAKQTYQSVITEKLGANYALFMSAFANIKAIIDPGTKTVDGITMAIRDGKTDPTGAGKGVPWYRVPMLDTLVQGWKSGSGLSPWEFDSQNSTTESSSETSEGGGGFTIGWRQLGLNANTQSSSSSSETSTKMQNFNVKWGSMALVKISRGVWDTSAIRLATALKDPVDEVAQQAVPAFEEALGSKESPGKMSIWNEKAIVGFQPAVTIEYSNEEEAQKMEQTAADAGINFGLFSIGGHGASSSESMTTKREGNKLTFNDGSMNVYILGFVQASFWDTDSTEPPDTSEL